MVDVEFFKAESVLVKTGNWYENSVIMQRADGQVGQWYHIMFLVYIHFLPVMNRFIRF